MANVIVSYAAIGTTSSGPQAHVNVSYAAIQATATTAQPGIAMYANVGGTWTKMTVYRNVSGTWS